MIGEVKASVVLAGTAWVEITTFDGWCRVVELWAKIPDNIGTGTNIIIGLFHGDYLTNGDERYNSGNLAENGTRVVRHVTESGTDLPMNLPGVRGDKLMVSADGAATATVEFVIYTKD